MRNKEAEGAAEVTSETVQKARLIFWGALVLSTLIVVQMVVDLRSSPAASPVLRGFLVTTLLWSFLLTAYSFHLVSGLVEICRRSGGRFTDQHTGVFTLDYLKSCLEQEYHRALETGVAATVIYVDMQHLERVNHSFGYTVGDIALKALAEVLSGNIRPGDILGRVGGDEFLIVLPETNLNDARSVAEGIEKAIGAYRLDLGKRGVIDYLRCRTGMAAFPAEGSTPEDIIAAAHQNMGEPVVA